MAIDLIVLFGKMEKMVEKLFDYIAKCDMPGKILRDNINCTNDEATQSSARVK